MQKTVLITGATAGFGQEMARRFSREGWKVIATGRRQERLDELVKELSPNPIHTLCFDIQDKDAVKASIEGLPEDFAAVDVLVNNAGLALGLEPAPKCDVAEWECMIDTNIKGLLYITHAILPGMVERNTGHVVNLGSIAGNYPYRGGNVYGGTKAFVKQFSKNLLTDLVETKVKVTNIEPGLCETEFSIVRFKGDKVAADKMYEGTQPITPVDIAETVYWVSSQPAHVNINSVEIMPVCQSCGPFTIHRDETD